MSFLTPLAFTLAILLPVIIAMYLLKLRRNEQLVSSTYLWQRMVRDVEANAPWQRLRRNLLLLLQLLFLLALIFALARPFSWAEGSIGQAAILIFDTSASMAATDLNPNRLEEAKAQARLLISNLPEEARGTIIAAGERAQVLVSSSQDKRQLYQALENLQAQPTSSDLTSALELASAIAARQPDADIVIYSDGQVTLPERLALQGRIRYLPIGESGNNQAISLLTLEPGSSENALTAFVQVSNYDDKPVQRRLNLSADGHLVDAHDLEIPAHGQVSVISEAIPPQTMVLEAVLNETDVLPLDDRAWVVQPTSSEQNITLVSDGNRFLETALGLLPDLQINTISIEDLAHEPSSESANLTIFDSLVTTDTLPTGNLLFIGPLASTSAFSITGSLETPVPQIVNPGDPLLAHVDLSAVSMLDAARMPLPTWARPVIVDESSGSPLLFAGEIGSQRLAVLTFDPRRSDLPLQVAYPILIANLVDWLLPGRIGDIPVQVTPGEVLTFSPPSDVTNLTVTRPDGTSSKLEIQGGRAFYADTTQLGVYTAKWETSSEANHGEGEQAFAINLFAPQESNTLPVENLSLLENATGIEESTSQQARREWWQPFAALALMIITAEWLVYNRATLSKLVHKLPFFQDSIPRQ
jgi:Ca-activated chloride channel family protein